MERREFLKLALGFTAAAGAIAATAATAQAAPMLPPSRDFTSGPKDQLTAEPAIATQDAFDAMQPEQVQWGWRRRRRWRRYYWRPRYWRRRYRRRYWRPRRRVYYY
jgi:hypothetical protein